MDQAPTEDIEYTRLGPVGTIIAGIILIVIGCILAFVLEHAALTHGGDSESWPSVVGAVTESEVTRTGPRNDRMYHPHVTYEYSVDDQNFTSSRINFEAGGIQSNIQEEMAEFIDQYRLGTKVDVYYNPDDPSISCLVTGMRLGFAFLLGMGCIVVGMVIVVSALIAGLRRGISKACV